MALKGAVAGGLYDELKAERDRLKEENDSLKKSNAQKTKVIHRLKAEKEELKKTHDELKEENKNLEEENKDLIVEKSDLLEEIEDLKKEKEFYCEECNLILTEDDIYGSVDCGHFACEKCRDKNEEEWATATDKISKENSDLHNELKKLKMKLKDQATYEKRIFVLEQELKEKRKVLAKHGKKEKKEQKDKEKKAKCDAVVEQAIKDGLITRIEPKSEEPQEEQSADDCVCITCECHYSDMKHKGKLGMDKRYAWYFGSEHDDGDMCSRCVRKLYKKYHP